MIASPTVFICDECVELCAEIIAYERLTPEQQVEQEAMMAAGYGG